MIPGRWETNEMSSRLLQIIALGQFPGCGVEMEEPGGARQFPWVEKDQIGQGG